MKEPTSANEGFLRPVCIVSAGDVFEGLVQRIMEVIHLPGLRGNPERTYPVTAVGPRFPGTFENYAASLISHWSTDVARHYQRTGRRSQGAWPDLEDRGEDGSMTPGSSFRLGACRVPSRAAPTI